MTERQNKSDWFVDLMVLTFLLLIFIAYKGAHTP